MSPLFTTVRAVHDNGGWCWFQDERAIVDGDRALIGSIASPSGDVQLTSVALDDVSQAATTVLHAGFETDDHDNPALWRRADGRLLAVYSRHKADDFTFWRISEPGDPTQWGPEQSFCWTETFGATEPAPRGTPGRNVTYQNVHQLDGRLFCFVRALNDDPCYLVSDDDGSTWTFGGRLLTRPKIGYVNGYARYCSGAFLGTDDRIDLTITEHHPRDFPTSIWHGFLARGGLHASDGELVGELYRGADDATPRAEDLTQVFASGTTVDGQVMSHCWTTDIRRDASGRVVILFTARTDDRLGLEVPRSTTEPLLHALLRAEWRPGGSWQVSRVADIGGQLVPHETDYTGLASIDPDDLDALYLSTPVDPRTGAGLGVHEILHGRLDGETWVWTDVTSSSSASNFRPIALPGARSRRVLTWYQGTMESSQTYTAQVMLAVGMR